MLADHAVHSRHHNLKAQLMALAASVELPDIDAWVQPCLLSHAWQNASPEGSASHGELSVCRVFTTVDRVSAACMYKMPWCHSCCGTHAYQQASMSVAGQPRD